MEPRSTDLILFQCQIMHEYDDLWLGQLVYLLL